MILSRRIKQEKYKEVVGNCFFIKVLAIVLFSFGINTSLFSEANNIFKNLKNYEILLDKPINSSLNLPSINFYAPAALPVTVNATIGTINSSYNTLKAAFDAINKGVCGGRIEILINSSTTESASCVLNASGTGSARYTSVKIYPTAASLKISGNLSAALIDFEGSDSITINGKYGTPSSATNLTLENISTSNNAYTVIFKNEATYNTFKNLTIKGANPGISGGTVVFGTSNVSTILGNSNNKIDSCMFTFAGASGAAANMIYSEGTLGKQNRNNVISNNEFVDFLIVSNNSSAININAASTIWTINNNSFYYTTAYAPNQNFVNKIIDIDNLTGESFYVYNNYIGGSQKQCGGAAWSKSVKSTNFTGIYLNVSSTSQSRVYNNVIGNFNWTNSAGDNWTAIDINEGNVSVGVLGANIIGSATGNNSITITNGKNGGILRGIYIESTTPTIIQNNIIGSIKTIATNTTDANNIIAIEKKAVAGDVNISFNKIGSTSTANSIQATSTSTGSPQTTCGIICGGKSTNTITSNTISNITNLANNDNNNSQAAGIVTTFGSNQISANTISEISTASSQKGNSNSTSAVGIAQLSTISGTVHTISGNSIKNIRNTNTSAATYVAGITYRGSATAGSKILANFVSGIYFSSSNILCDAEGISLYLGVVTCANNVIRLGETSLGYQLFGIWDNGGTGNNANIYFNTVYLGGSVSSGSSSQTAALYSESTASTRDYRNNILVNSRTGGTLTNNNSIYLKGIAGLLINSNDYICPAGGNIGKIGTTSYASLANWKSGTVQDVNSLSTAPAFVNQGGSSATDYRSNATLVGVAGTGILSDYDGLNRFAIPKMGAFEDNNYVWFGTSSTDFATAGNWQGGTVPPDGADIVFAANPVNSCYLDKARIIHNITNTQGIDLFVLNGNQLTLTGDLIFSGGAKLDATSINSKLVLGGLLAQSLPVGSIVSNTINRLSIDNTFGLTQNENFTISDSLILKNGTMNIGANTLTINGGIKTINGVLNGGVTSSIIFGGTSANTKLPSVTLKSLQINRPNGITLGGSVIVQTTLNLTTGTLTLDTNKLTIRANAISKTSGNIDASNTKATIQFENSLAMTLPLGLFVGQVNNLTINGIGGLTASENITIGGILNLQQPNPTSIKGLLDMSTFVLNMTEPATTIGQGDVIGIIKRSSFVANKAYSFGNQYTVVSFPAVGTMPSDWSMKVSIGVAPAWKTVAVQRIYEVMRTGGSGLSPNIKFFYKPSELNGNNELSVVVFDNPSSISTERGKINQSDLEHWVSLTLDLSLFPTSFGVKQFALSAKESVSIVWDGSVSTDWNNSSNWTPSTIPGVSDDVVIPANCPNYPILPSSPAAAIKSLNIQSGGLVNGSNQTITITGINSWTNNGDFNAGKSTAAFTNANATIAGVTNFYNLSAIGASAFITLTTNAVTGIAGSFSVNAGRISAARYPNTVNYNGSGKQQVVNANGYVTGYSKLILSNTNYKILPNTLMNISGDFSVYGTVKASATQALNITGNVYIDSNSTLNLDTALSTQGDMTIAGNFENDGTFISKSAWVYFKGSAEQRILGRNESKFYQIELANTAADLVLYSDVTAKQNLLLTSGNLNVRRVKLNVGNNISGNSKIITTQLSKLKFSGTAAQIIADNRFLYTPVDVQSLEDSNTVSLALGNQSFTVDTLILTKGTLDMSGKTLSIDKYILKTNGTITSTNTSILNINDDSTKLTIPDNTFLTPILGGLTINRSGGMQLGNQSISINNLLTLTLGIINTNSSNIILNANASYTGGSKASCIYGFCTKTGNTVFTFPLGDKGFYAPAKISAPTVVTDQFTASYYKKNPTTLYDTSRYSGSIKRVSGAEYWIINRTAGTSNVNVTLSWGPQRSGGVTNTSTLLVARWTGALWEDKGNTALVGDTATGGVTSSPVTSFSPFTLATSSLTDNPLPISLIEFGAKCNGAKVDLHWETATETNNDYFTLERNVNTTEWEEVAKISGAGNSYSPIKYEYTDDLGNKTSDCYRLKQTDYDGKFTYSKTIFVRCRERDDWDLYTAILPNPTTGIFTVTNITGTVKYTIYNNVGALIDSGVLTEDNSEIDLSDKSQGIYNLILEKDNEKIMRKVAIIPEQ